MKKATRFFVFGGLICLLAGGVIMLVTGCIGGIDMLHDIATKYSFHGPDFVYNFGDDDDFGEFDVIMSDERIDVSANEIHSVRIEAEGMTLCMAQGNTSDIVLSTSNGFGMGAEYHIENGTLFIKSNDNFISFSGDVIVFIPGDLLLKQLEIKAGAGEVEVNEIHAEEMRLDIGACTTSLKNVSADNMIINVGAGEVDLEGAEIADTITARVGMGEIDFEGIVGGNIDLDCGMGNVEFHNRGKAYDDYNYNVKCGAGNVEVGDFSYSGLSTWKKIDNGSTKTMEIDCGMGNVEISF